MRSHHLWHFSRAARNWQSLGSARFSNALFVALRPQQKQQTMNNNNNNLLNSPKSKRRTPTNNNNPLPNTGPRSLARPEMGGDENGNEDEEENEIETKTEIENENGNPTL